MDKNIVYIGIGCVIAAVIMSIVQSKRIKVERQETEDAMSELNRVLFKNES